MEEKEKPKSKSKSENQLFTMKKRREGGDSRTSDNVHFAAIHVVNCHMNLR